MNTRRTSAPPRQPAYDEHARSYERDTAAFQPYRRAVVEALPLHSGQVVLDVGCGTGLCCGPLRDKVGLRGGVVGIEESPEMAAVAREHIACEGWENVTVVQAAGSSRADRRRRPVLRRPRHPAVPGRAAERRDDAARDDPGKRLSRTHPSQGTSSFTQVRRNRFSRQVDSRRGCSPRQSASILTISTGRTIRYPDPRSLSRCAHPVRTVQVQWWIVGRALSPAPADRHRRGVTLCGSYRGRPRLRVRAWWSCLGAGSPGYGSAPALGVPRRSCSSTG